MSTTPTLTVPRSSTLNETVLRFIILCTCLTLCGPLCVFAAAYLLIYAREHRSTRLWASYSVTGLVAAACILASTTQISEHLRTTFSTFVTLILQHDVGRAGLVAFTSLFPVWLVMVPLAPLGAVIMEIWDRLAKLLGTKTVPEMLVAERAAEANHQERIRKWAEQAAQDEPTQKAHFVALGPYVTGKTDRFPTDLGLEKRDAWLYVHEDVFYQHLYIQGAPGAGKTVTILRIVAELLKNPDCDVYLVDGKAMGNVAEVFRALAYQAGRGDVPIFRLGHEQPGALYNGFYGNAEPIYNRLLSIAGVQKAEGNAEFYADANRVFLHLVCHVAEGPPRDFETLMQRLDLSWVRQQYRTKGYLASWLEPREREQQIEDLKTRLLPYVLTLEHLVNSHGFVIDETRAAVFSVRTLSVGDTAKRFLHFLLEDFKDYIGKSSRQKRQGVLIIDEFSQLGAANIIDLLSLAREAKMGVVLATQDIEGVGDEALKRLILANCGTKLLLRSDYPEEVAALAGTIYQIESSIQSDAQGPTGQRGDRVQHAFKIDMNEAGSLRTLEGFLIRQRYTAKVRVAPLDRKKLEELIAATPPEHIPQLPELSIEREESKKTTKPQRNIY